AGNYTLGAGVFQGGVEDPCHAENRADQAKPYAVAASPSGYVIEGCEPEPTIAVDRCRTGRDEPGGCREGRRHGPADAAGRVHRFNGHGLAGLKNSRRRGNPRRLSTAQQAELAQLWTGPDPAVDGVVVDFC